MGDGRSRPPPSPRPWSYNYPGAYLTILKRAGRFFFILDNSHRLDLTCAVDEKCREFYGLLTKNAPMRKFHLVGQFVVKKFKKPIENTLRSMVTAALPLVSPL